MWQATSTILIKNVKKLLTCNVLRDKNKGFLV